jgi:hypothetical protein
MKRFVIVSMLLFLLSVHAQGNELPVRVNADPVLIGNTLDVETDITNTGGIAADFVVILTIANAIDGDIDFQDQQTIPLGPGGTISVIFENIDTTDLDPNNYQIVLTAENGETGSIQTGVLYLEAITAATPTFIPEFHPILLLAIIVGVLAVTPRK